MFEGDDVCYETSELLWKPRRTSLVRGAADTCMIGATWNASTFLDIAGRVRCRLGSHCRGVLRAVIVGFGRLS